jgi:hypothetical protein
MHHLGQDHHHLHHHTHLYWLSEFPRAWFPFLAFCRLRLESGQNVVTNQCSLRHDTFRLRILSVSPADG